MYRCMRIFLGQLIMTSLTDSEVTHHLAKPGQPWQRHRPRNLSRVAGAVIEPRGPIVRRSSPEGKARLKNATYFSNLLVLIVREANTSRPGRKKKFLFLRLGSEPPAPKWKEKERERILGLFCLAQWTLCLLSLWEGGGGYLGASLCSGPETLPSISHQKKKKKVPESETGLGSPGQKLRAQL